MRRGLAAGLLVLACGAGAPAAKAAPGDLAVADEGNASGGTGLLVSVTPGGAADVLASGGSLRNPWAVAVAPDGAMLLADEGAEAIFRVTPAGAVSTVASDAMLDDPVGIALAPAGIAYVSDRNDDAVLRLDLASGRLTKLADLRDAAGLAFDRAGKLLVTDERALRRVDPGTGAVTTAAQGAPLDRPRDVAVALDGTDFVVDGARVLRISPAGAKSVLASGAPLDDPAAIDIEADGDLVVADRNGAVIHVDRDTGAMSALARGGALRRPTGIASVGGAGVDASGGGNGDRDGPAAPPRPPPPPPPASGGTGGSGGTPGGGTPGPGGTTIVTNPDGTTTVTRPDGIVVILPAGVTPATSGIKGVDFVAPSLGRPRLGSTRFRAAHRGRAFVSVSIGTRIFYKLSEAARILIAVQKYRPLSPVCKRRLANQSRHRTGLRCRKYVSVKGGLAKASTAGLNSVRFRGRLRGKRLKPGRYRFVIRARDGAGNVSKPRRPHFRIVR